MSKARNRIERGWLFVDGVKLSGAEELRLAVSNLNATREGFNDQFTAAQLLQINRMLVLGEWDILPDMWTRRQVKEALAGVPPQFDDQERPVYRQ